MGFSNLDIIDVIGDVVDSMRLSGSYTASFDGTNSTVTADNSFQPMETVIINSTDYLIISATSTEFVIKGDVTSENTYQAAAPYFSFGHILEIANELTKKDNSTGLLKFQKYPIILLPLDVVSQFNQLRGTFDYENVRILIANRTQPQYTATQRRANNFIPTLWPLYETFIEKLSRAVGTENGSNIPFISHKKTDRFFWGTELNSNSTKNIVNDFLDCVEISELNIKVKKINC